MTMKQVLHVIGGDIAGDSLKRSGLAGEVFVWHDILYDGPRRPGWPDDATLHTRAQFIEDATGKGLSRKEILKTLKAQYVKVEQARDYDEVVLWFDACLFDQSMLSHILACMNLKSFEKAELICVGAFPGIVPFDGLGQLLPSQLASLHDQRQPVTTDQFRFAERVDKAFAMQDKAAFLELSKCQDAPLPWVPAAVTRWLQEQSEEASGLGRLEQLVLDALYSGARTPSEILAFAVAHDTRPLFWGDTTLWAKINGLATRETPIVRIEGPERLLPQWNDQHTLQEFRIYLA
jgi:hypothetical protein